MRLPYTPNPPSFPPDSPSAQTLERVLARRGPGGLLAIDRTLLHAPAIADGFNSFFGALRSPTLNSLPEDVRELAFLRVAALTRCWYEWDIHFPIAKRVGVGEGVLEFVKRGEEISGKGNGKSGGSNVLDERQRVVVEYADAMTGNGERVGDELFKGLRGWFSDKEVVELTASIAGFNVVTRLVVALDVGERNSG